MCQIEIEQVWNLEPLSKKYALTGSAEMLSSLRQMGGELRCLLAPNHILEKPRFRRKRKDTGFGHDQVIEYPHVDECERFPEPSRDELIRGARLGMTRRVVVKEHHRCRIVRKRRFDDFTRINGRVGDRSTEEILDRDQPVSAVQVQHAKDLVVAGAQMHAQELTRQRRSGKNG